MTAWQAISSLSSVGTESGGAPFLIAAVRIRLANILGDKLHTSDKCGGQSHWSMTLAVGLDNGALVRDASDWRALGHYIQYTGMRTVVENLNGRQN
jgi:hypothetical protein